MGWRGRAQGGWAVHVVGDGWRLSCCVVTCQFASAIYSDAAFVVCRPPAPETMSAGRYRQVRGRGGRDAYGGEREA